MAPFPADYALLFALGIVDEERRRVHAHAVVDALRLDPRLEAAIPLPPDSRTKRRIYENALAGLRDISELKEPERTSAIEKLYELVARQSR